MFDSINFYSPTVHTIELFFLRQRVKLSSLIEKIDYQEIGLSA